MKALESIGYVTPRDYSAYVKFHVLRGKYYRLKSALIVFGLVLLGSALVAYGFMTRSKGLVVGGGAILLCLLMFFYTINTNVKRICNSKAKTVRAMQKVTFGKNGFALDLLFQNEEENEHDEIFFDELEMVYDAKTAIYVYIEKRSVIIIPKRNLRISPEEARAFLVKYIPSQKLTICE